MNGDPSVRLAELRQRTWTTPEEYEALNREYDEALSELARSLTTGNAAIGSAAQLASTAGTNYRDRQSIKRKAERWKAGFRAMPAIERGALLAALLEAMIEDAN